MGIAFIYVTILNINDDFKSLFPGISFSFHRFLNACLTEAGILKRFIWRYTLI